MRVLSSLNAPLRLALFAAMAFAGTDQAAVIEAVAPVYPLVAVYSATSGEVELQVKIDKTGLVTAVKVVRGHRLLVPASEEAAKKWRFASSENEREVTVVFSFRILPKGTSDSELATRYRAPFQIEVRRVIPEPSSNSDPAADPPRRKSK